MNITAITKFKEGTLFNLLKKLGWTQGELAKRSGLSQSTIGNFINLLRKPSKHQADAIQAAFGEVGEFLDVLSIWPESFTGLKARIVIEQTKEVDDSVLLDWREHERSRLQYGADSERIEDLRTVISQLENHGYQRDIRLLEDKFINSLNNAELEKKYKIGPARISQIVYGTRRKAKRLLEQNRQTMECADVIID